RHFVFGLKMQDIVHHSTGSKLPTRDEIGLSCQNKSREKCTDCYIKKRSHDWAHAFCRFDTGEDLIDSIKTTFETLLAARLPSQVSSSL
ncbi:unnamed protein product, partial [Allacma fusca]